MGKDNRQEEVQSGRYRARTEANLVLGGFAILVLVGGALMFATLGAGPASIGVGTILVVFGVFLLLVWGLGLLDHWLRRG